MLQNYWMINQHSGVFCPLQVVVPNSVSAGQIAAFSSFGPALDLSFKPDLSAPGNLIVSCCSKSRPCC